MGPLVSPKYSLQEFCDAMCGKDIAAVMDAVSAEISAARRFHRETTKASDFRKGSKGREYCDNLQSLLYMLMNGSVPNGKNPEFLATVKPLFDHLLKKWEIGTLRQFFSQAPKTGHQFLLDAVDPLIIVVSKAEVEGMDTTTALATLKTLTESPETAKAFVERVDIAFHGYDHSRHELFEIPEVRNFVYELDQQFPYWLFFLSKRYLGLQCLLFCFLPPFLTEDARSRLFPERIGQLLTRRWFPAMNHICQFASFSESQIERLTDRALRYITTGRFPADAEPFA